MKTRIQAGALLVLFACSGAIADTGTGTDTATGAGTSTASTELAKPKSIGDTLAFTYFGIYRGAAVNDPGNSFQPAVDGSLDHTSPQSMENYVTTGYKINKDLMAGVSTHFFYTPLGIPAAKGIPFEMLDPSLVISKANMIDTQGLKVKGLFYVELPMSQNDRLRPNNELTALSPTINASYDVPNSRLNIGLYAYVTAYMAGPDSAGTYRSYKIYAAPNFNYQLSPKFSATTWVDLVQITRNTGTPFIDGMNNPAMDIEPGINWEFAPGYNFNPMINIYPETPTLAATSFQAVVTGKFF